jgi:hypothetical protein
MQTSRWHDEAASDVALDAYNAQALWYDVHLLLVLLSAWTSHIPARRVDLLPAKPCATGVNERTG